MGFETSSKRYAKALIGYGVEKDNLDILFSEFSSLIETLDLIRTFSVITMPVPNFVLLEIFAVL